MYLRKNLLCKRSSLPLGFVFL